MVVLTRQFFNLFFTRTSYFKSFKPDLERLQVFGQSGDFYAISMQVCLYHVTNKVPRGKRWWEVETTLVGLGNNTVGGYLSHTARLESDITFSQTNTHIN